MNTLAERLKKALQQTTGKTQAGLARACGIKPPSVSDWMNGNTKSVEGSNLIKASEYLGVRSKWLATGLGPMNDQESLSIFLAQEEGATYEIKKWPFKTISPGVWASIPLHKRDVIEEQIRGMTLSSDSLSKLKA